jgi:type VI protein secretion system component Hcp
MFRSMCQRVVKTLRKTKTGRRAVRRPERSSRAVPTLEALESRDLPSATYMLKFDTIPAPSGKPDSLANFTVTSFQFAPIASSGKSGPTTPGSVQLVISGSQSSAPLLHTLTTVRQSTATLMEMDGPTSHPARATWKLDGATATTITMGAAADGTTTETVTLEYSSLTEQSYDMNRNRTWTASWNSLTGAGSAPVGFGDSKLSGAGGVVLDFGDNTGQLGVVRASTTVSNAAIAGKGFTAAPTGGTFTVSTAYGPGSPNILAMLALGHVFASGAASHKVTLTDYTTSTKGDTPWQFQRYELSDVTVVSDMVTSGAPDNSPLETFTIHYGKVTETVTPLPQVGKPTIPATSATYDFGKGTAIVPADFGRQPLAPTGTVIDFGSGQASVDSYAIAYTNPVQTRNNGSIAPGIAQGGTMTITTEADAAAPGIFAGMAAQGSSLKAVTVTTYLTQKGKPAGTLRLTLRDVFITSDTPTIGHGGGPTDTFTLQFRSLAQDVTAPSARPGVTHTSDNWDFIDRDGGGSPSFGGQTVKGLPAISIGDTQIAVSSYSFGATAIANNEPHSSVAALNELQFTAPAGLATPALFLAVARGESPDKATLIVPTSDGKNVSERIALAGVLVVGDRITLDSSGQPQESVTLAYSQMQESTYGFDIHGKQISTSTATVREVQQAGLSPSPWACPSAALSGDGYQYFLRIQDIPGTTTSTNHRGDFNALGFSESIQANRNTAVAGDIAVALPVNPASASLLAAMAAGRSFADVDLIGARPVRGTLTDTLIWNLGNVTITSDGTSGGVEVLTLHFQSLKETVIPLTPDQNSLLAPVSTNWDLGSNHVSGATTFGMQKVTGQAITLDFGSGQTGVGSFSTTVAQPVTLDKLGVAHAAGHPSVGDVTINLPLNATAPGILANLAPGKSLARVKLTVIDTKGKQVQETLDLTDVTIVSEQQSPGASFGSEVNLVLRAKQINHTDSSGKLVKTETAAASSN